MQVQVLFFALYRDLAGTSSAPVELPPQASVAHLITHLRTAFTGLAALPPDPAVAVNREYAGPAHVLSAGDEVALIPPVSGG